MLKPKNTKQFKKDLKKYEHNKLILKELYLVIAYLLNEQVLPNQYRDHALLGNWQGRRECHIKNDTLLIYKLLPEERAIRFERIGSHSEVLNM